MKLTKKSIYAFNILGQLLECSDTKVSGKDIAKKHNLSEAFITLVLRDLKLANIVKSKKGPGGGYVLSRNPDSITVKQVLDAVGEGYKQSDKDVNNFCGEILVELDNRITDFTAFSLADFKQEQNEGVDDCDFSI